MVHENQDHRESTKSIDIRAISDVYRRAYLLLHNDVDCN
jgi:hypothetical protein